MIPKDPFLLLSWINTQLRDFYPPLDELCLSLNLDRRSIEATLMSIGYCYDPETNSFV